MSLKADVREIRVELREVREHQERQTQAIDELKQRVWGMVTCAAPSTCLRLEPRISEHEGRIRGLEDERNRAVGGIKVVMLVATGAGALIGALMSWVLKFI